MKSADELFDGSDAHLLSEDNGFEEFWLEADQKELSECSYKESYRIAYLAGMKKGLEKAAEIAENYSDTCFGSMYSKKIATAIRAERGNYELAYEFRKSE
jgi:hypothetical protein